MPAPSTTVLELAELSLELMLAVAGGARGTRGQEQRISSLGHHQLFHPYSCDD